ncbi:hypothetical protein [Halostagnicola kamekurae]|uniref:hypothetical protein n=1 Tax=Halostagnicola kamekurae TaxID=619731 RepID=UPI000B8A5509|nr:hypothetical protein [Halostagnicola kamekurae]
MIAPSSSTFVQPASSVVGVSRKKLDPSKVNTLAMSMFPSSTAPAAEESVAVPTGISPDAVACTIGPELS